MDVRPEVRQLTPYKRIGDPEGYEYGFYVPFERDMLTWLDVVVPWVYERFGPQDNAVWYVRSDIIWFSDPDCAMEFKLRWV